MSRLDNALSAIKDRSSLYWAFYQPDELGEFETVEVRLNGRSETAAGFTPPTGWTLHRIQWGDTFFIRRRQATTEPMIEDMLCDMLHFAALHGMTFSSWQAGSDLVPDGFHP